MFQQRKYYLAATIFCLIAGIPFDNVGHVLGFSPRFKGIGPLSPSVLAHDAHKKVAIGQTWNPRMVIRDDNGHGIRYELPRPIKLFVFGVGYTGLALAHAAKARWQDVEVFGTCRSAGRVSIQP